MVRKVARAAREKLGAVARIFRNLAIFVFKFLRRFDSRDWTLAIGLGLLYAGLCVACSAGIALIVVGLILAAVAIFGVRNVA